MIQRIQTVYLFIAFLLGVLIFFLPFAEIHTPESVFVFTPTGIFSAGDQQGQNLVNVYPVISLLIAHLIITMLTVFLYTNRLLQIKLGKLNILLLLGLLVSVLLYLDQGAAAAEIQHGKSVISYGISTFIPVISIVFVFLANRSIRKDEELVRSTERLR